MSSYYGLTVRTEIYKVRELKTSGLTDCWLVHTSSQWKHTMWGSADSIENQLNLLKKFINAISCTDWQNIKKFTVNSSNKKQQPLKIANFQLALKVSNFEPDWLSFTYNGGTDLHLQVKLWKSKEGGESVLIYT